MKVRLSKWVKNAHWILPITYRLFEVGENTDSTLKLSVLAKMTHPPEDTKCWCVPIFGTLTPPPLGVITESRKRDKVKWSNDRLYELLALTFFLIIPLVLVRWCCDCSPHRPKVFFFLGRTKTQFLNSFSLRWNSLRILFPWSLSKALSCLNLQTPSSLLHKPSMKLTHTCKSEHNSSPKDHFPSW